MNNPTIYRVKSHDWELLQAIAKATFTETFSQQNDLQHMNLYLANKLNQQQLTKELNHPESSFYFVQIAGEVAGYLKLNTGAAQTEPQDKTAIEIERIYVLAKHQGKKRGKALLLHAIDVAKSQNLSFIWLGVWEENRKAIAFYERQGFYVFGQHGFQLGNEKQIDLMMRKDI